jgi:hypothetical protein
LLRKWAGKVFVGEQELANSMTQYVFNRLNGWTRRRRIEAVAWTGLSPQLGAVPLMRLDSAWRCQIRTACF